jgi:hypothetical protein
MCQNRGVQPATATLLNGTWLTRNRGGPKVAEFGRILAKLGGIRAFKNPVKYCGFTIILNDCRNDFNDLQAICLPAIRQGGSFAIGAN